MSNTDMSNDDTVKFFVYGTLKKGGRLSGAVQKFLRTVKKGSVKGKLYNVGAYPAAILNTNGDGTIKGEIHEFDNPTKIHEILDSIEGYYGPNNKNNLYNKVKTEIITEKGVETCYMYEFNRSVDTLPVIESGIWKVSKEASV